MDIMTDKFTQTTSYPNLVIQNIENMNIFNSRMNEIIENSDDYLSDFYEESPNYKCCYNNNNIISGNIDFVSKLVWLTYSDKEKKDILDEELDEYFN